MPYLLNSPGDLAIVDEPDPLAALNLGLIEIQRDGAEAILKFKLVSHNVGGALQPVIRFENDWLN